MPDPIIMAAISAGAQGANTIMTSRNNKKQREWNEKMYGIQRQDALSDWHMQNAYNTPAAQMQRLKEAGLNPNLVYGNGADAGAVGSVRQADVKSWSPETPQFDATSVVGAYLNAKMNQAQTDNMAVQKTVMEKDAQLRDAQILATYANIANTESKTARNQFDLGLASDLRNTSLEAAKLNVQKLSAQIAQTEANTKFTINQDARNAITTSTNVEMAAYRMKEIVKNMELKDWQIKEINQRINNLIKDGKLKDFEIKMNAMGFTKNDPAYQRFFTNMILGKHAPEVDKAAEDWIQDFKKKNPSITNFLNWLKTLSAY